MQWRKASGPIERLRPRNGQTPRIPPPTNPRNARKNQGDSPRQHRGETHHWYMETRRACVIYLALGGWRGLEAAERGVLEHEVALAGVLQPEPVGSDQVKPALHPHPFLRATGRVRRWRRRRRSRRPHHRRVLHDRYLRPASHSPPPRWLPRRIRSPGRPPPPLAKDETSPQQRARLRSASASPRLAWDWLGLRPRGTFSLRCAFVSLSAVELN